MTTQPAARRLPLRHPAEISTFVVLVVINAVIFMLLLDFVLSAKLVPHVLRGTGWEITIRAAAGAILLMAPALVVVRQLQPAAIRGTAVQLSHSPFPDLRDENRSGLRFILGHEAAHIRLSHVALWYQLVICYSQLTPILGPTLAPLLEYSCVRNGAALEPDGEIGLGLLTAGRCAADAVQVDELADQGRHLGGFWVGIGQLPRSHPWTVRRIWRLRQLSLFGGPDVARQSTSVGGPPSVVRCYGR